MNERRQVMNLHIKVLGVHIYISRRAKRNRRNTPDRSNKDVRAARMAYAGGRCELCGLPVTSGCTLYHLLPPAHPRRHSVANVRVICKECHRHVQTVGAYRPMIEKGGER